MARNSFAREENALDDLIQRRLRQFAPNRPIRIRMAELPTVREPEQLRQASGYRLEFIEEDGTRVIDLNEVVNRFPSMTSFSVDRRFYNIAALGRTRRLRELSIDTMPRGETLELASIVGLEHLGVGDGIERIQFDHPMLKGLAVFGPNADAEWFDGFGPMPKLKSVSLYKLRLTDLTPLHRLRGIQSLWVCQFRKLTSLVGIEGIGESLHELDLFGCRQLDDLSRLSRATSLRVLRLESLGEVSTLEPLADLPYLETLIVEGTSFRDGRTSVLDRAPSLKELYFRNKAHYDKKLKQFVQAI